MWKRRVTWSICMQADFWSTPISFRVTKTQFWSAFKQIENSLLVQFELMKVDQKCVFEQFINQVTLNFFTGPKRWNPTYSVNTIHSIFLTVKLPFMVELIADSSVIFISAFTNISRTTLSFSGTSIYLIIIGKI